MPVDTPDHVYQELLAQIESGDCILFLGSGSTCNCRRANGDRGLRGDELAKEILMKLNDGHDPGFTSSLMESAEFFITWKAAAKHGLDKLIQDRLGGLQPTIGHYLATTYPWQAVITTNYNQVAEDCWGAAISEGFAASGILPIRKDDDLDLHAGDKTHTRLYKPHGCITMPDQQKHRMVLSSLDYFESEKIRPRIYSEIRGLSKHCTTLFMGYSMTDYTFRNIYYRLYQELGQWAVRSYSVTPIRPILKYQWMSRSLDKNFNTTVVNDTFDTFMVRLTMSRRRLHATAKRRALELWDQMISDCSNVEGMNFTSGIARVDFENLPA